jgi:predicted DCC family thiol-disulfide oxidoreductase YuxK
MAGDRYTLLYDGHCVFCTSSRDLIKRWDRQDRIEALSFQEPGVLERFPAISYERAMQSMHVISPDGSIHGEEEAVRALLRFAPLYLRWAAWLFYVPGVPWIVRRLYRFIARNRYRLNGKTACDDGACAVHLGGRPDGEKR